MTKLEKDVAAYRATGRIAFIKRDRQGKVKAVALDGRTMTVEAATAKMAEVMGRAAAIEECAAEIEAVGEGKPLNEYAATIRDLKNYR